MKVPPTHQLDWNGHRCSDCGRSRYVVVLCKSVPVARRVQYMHGIKYHRGRERLHQTQWPNDVHETRQPVGELLPDFEQKRSHMQS